MILNIKIEVKDEAISDQYGTAADILLAIDGVTGHNFKIESAEFQSEKKQIYTHRGPGSWEPHLIGKSRAISNEQRDGTGTNIVNSNTGLE